MIAVGIDPSLTSTGVAVIVDGKLTHYARYGRPGHNGASYTSRSRRIRRLVREVAESAFIYGPPDLFVIEEHPYGIGAHGAEFDRAGLWHGIFGNLDARNIPGVAIHPGTAKSWVTGVGNAQKADVIAVVDDWYAGTIDPPLASWLKKDNADDVADAIGFAVMAAYKMGDPIPFEPKERHRTPLMHHPWPEKATAR